MMCNWQLRTFDGICFSPFISFITPEISVTLNAIFFCPCHVSRETSRKGAQLRCASLEERRVGIFWSSLRVRD
jgi:hypothetical protein